MLGGEGADQKAAFALYAQSAELLRGIIDKKADLALVNSARFQLGEILLNEAAFSPDDRKPALLEQAREAFRGVLPKDTIVAVPAANAHSTRLIARPNATAANSPNSNPAPTRPSPPCKKSARATSRPDNTTNPASSSPTPNRSSPTTKTKNATSTTSP